MSAVFSPCDTYRYALGREWASGNGTLNFLMLNPSTADSVKNDPTVERCEQRARKMGFRRLIVTNLFAFRSTDPKWLRLIGDPVGPENDRFILAAAKESRMVIAAWGDHGKLFGRSSAVRAMLSGVNLHALKLNASGEPKHPLYCSYETKPFLI